MRNLGQNTYVEWKKLCNSVQRLEEGSEKRIYLFTSFLKNEGSMLRSERRTSLGRGIWKDSEARW